MHLKPTGTIVMPSMYMLRYGITGDDMRFRKARRIPTRSKATMRNSDTIWRVWHALPGVSPDVRMLSTVQFGYLSTTSICANYVNTNSRSTPSTSPTSFPHPFSHSLENIRQWNSTKLTRNALIIFMKYSLIILTLRNSTSLQENFC